GLRDRLPPAVRAHLEAGARGETQDTPKPGDPVLAGVTNVVIGNNGLVVDAAVEEARRLGLAPCLLTRRLQGEAREVARVFGALLDETARGGLVRGRPACLIAGGETTVTVRGRGAGGRCQEFTLARVPEIATMRDIVVLAAGTDGSDGPTTAAGAVADSTTLEQARGRGLDARGALADNDSHSFFAALDDLVVTGPTGSNLMDVYLGLVG